MVIMARSMYIGAIALVSLTLAGVRVQAQSEFKAEIGKTLTDSEECWPSVSSEHAQDSRGTVAEHRGTEHEFHRNHFGGFLGASTHSDTDETAFTLGLEYARQFTLRWAVVSYIELVSSDLERDIILAVGAIFYPMRRLGLVVAPGVESASKDVEHHGKVEKENEAEFLLRLGAAYGFPVGQASLGPAVFVDWAGNQWTLVYGIGMVTGF
jgi:hypothetical protein